MECETTNEKLLNVKTLTAGISVLDFGKFEVIFLNFVISLNPRKDLP